MKGMLVTDGQQTARARNISTKQSEDGGVTAGVMAVSSSMSALLNAMKEM